MSKRISIVINSLVQGDAQKSAILLAKELEAKGNKVMLLTFYPKETDFFIIPSEIEVRRFVHPFQDIGRLQGNRLMVRFKRIISRIKDFKDLRACFSEFQPDLVISFEAATSIITYFSTKNQCPIIISETVHPEHHPIPRWAKKLRHHVYASKRTILHCQGKQIASWMKREFQKNIFVIPNFVGSKSSDIWSRNSRKIKIFSRYSSQKGIDLAIIAWSQLPDDLRKRYTLEIFGDGDRHKYQKIVDDFDLNLSITLFGPTKNLKDELTDCLIFLMPSRFEGFPNALVEAMNFGIPSLATDCPSAIREVTQEGKMARLSEVTPEGISRNLIEMLRNDDLLSNFNMAGLKVSNIFSDSNTILEWLELIDWVLSGEKTMTMNCKVCGHCLGESTVIGYKSKHGLIRELNAEWGIKAIDAEMGEHAIIGAYSCSNCKSVSFSGAQGDTSFYDACYRSPLYSRTNRWDYLNCISELSSRYTQIRVLDFGGGISPLTALNDDLVKVTVIDLSSHVRQELENRRVRSFANLHDLPNGEKFDFIMFSHTIEHLDNPIKTLSDLINLLDKNGKIAITTPDSDSANLLDSPLAWPPHHVIALNPSALKEQMAALGLQEIQTKRNKDLQNSNFDFMCVGVKKQ
jgi:GalNAc-alpha-(1->4)-GalNAc-alpha-(1->3)-diNAcBac-PP-undecaprenol alpha-1,4-N-acetyl-D-galactosaminyltransferase